MEDLAFFNQLYKAVRLLITILASVVIFRLLTRDPIEMDAARHNPSTSPRGIDHRNHGAQACNSPSTSPWVVATDMVVLHYQSTSPWGEAHQLWRGRQTIIQRTTFIAIHMIIATFRDQTWVTLSCVLFPGIARYRMPAAEKFFKTFPSARV